MTLIGIIGGTGLEDPTIFTDRKEVNVPTTPWGNPSTIFSGQISGIDCYFLTRHGKNHDKSPTQVNYCGNLWALKELGVTHIIASTACGSLKEEYAPGDMVAISDFIDMTKQRTLTHIGTAVENGGPKGTIHLPSKPAFDEKLRNLIIKAMENTQVPYKQTGTMVTIEGPRFSSLAESKIFSGVFNADIINMTTCPEVNIAKEMKMQYASIAMVTDYDCWKENEEVSVEKVMKQMKLNAISVKKILIELIPTVQNTDWSEEQAALVNMVNSSIF